MTGKPDQRIAVVTGSSSGMGFETSLALARNGIHTYATVRKLDGGGGSKQIEDIAKSENLPLEVIQLDVNNDKSVSDAIDKIVSEKNRIDVVVNNAGYGFTGALEETSMDEIRAQFETNFFGAVRVMKSVIPIMRKQKTGIIVNTTSLSGKVPLPLESAYTASKFALEGISESIRYELEPLGIKSTDTRNTVTSSNQIYAHQSPDSLDGIPSWIMTKEPNEMYVSGGGASLALPFGSAYSAGTLRIRVSDA